MGEHPSMMQQRAPAKQSRKSGEAMMHFVNISSEEWMKPTLQFSPAHMIST